MEKNLAPGGALGQMRLAPLKRLTDGMINLTTAHWTRVTVVPYLLARTPASAISPRACFDLAGACWVSYSQPGRDVKNWGRLPNSNVR
jgi:hypothetical protein